GYGKRTPIEEYPQHGRGGQGVIAIQCSDRNGELVGAVQVDDSHELMLVSDQGTLVRTRAAEVSVLGRNTQGVTLIRVAKDERLIGVDRVEAVEEDEETTGEAGDDAPASADGQTESGTDAPASEGNGDAEQPEA
ncbi:MAG: DNA gyrase subunit A, partial [Xanthomonadales bacterium]|nr:DNA gyrase subunit A [Xanthomonadales bacterium]